MRGDSEILVMLREIVDRLDRIERQHADLAFWRYADLKERRIVSSRPDLHNKQKLGFPKAVKLRSADQRGQALFSPPSRLG
jgi:hypothetical protein